MVDPNLRAVALMSGVTIMESKSEADLKKLAWDIHAGHVFTNRHIRPGDERLAQSIFMVFIFMDEEDRKSLKDAGMIYEYNSKAGPRAINGYPMFMSCRLLNVEDTNKVWEYVREIETLQKEFQGDESGS